MTQLEMMLFSAQLPFDEDFNSCADAAEAALWEYPRAIAALKLARKKTSGDIITRATLAARLSGCRPDNFRGNAPAFGVMENGKVIAARIGGEWWIRGAHGIRRIRPNQIVAAWRVD